MPLYAFACLCRLCRTNAKMIKLTTCRRDWQLSTLATPLQNCDQVEMIKIIISPYRQFTPSTSKLQTHSDLLNNFRKIVSSNFDFGIIGLSMKLYQYKNYCTIPSVSTIQRNFLKNGWAAAPSFTKNTN